MKPNHKPIEILEALRDKLQRGADGLDVAGDSASSSWLENMAEDIRTVLRILNDREDHAFEALIALAFRRGAEPDPDPLTAEDVDEANLPELTDEERAALNSIDIEAILSKASERPTDSAIEAAVAVYDRIVGEATTMGHLLAGDELGDPNRFDVRVKAGEFKRIVARAIDAGIARAVAKAREGLELARSALGIDGEGRCVKWMDEYFAALPRSLADRWAPADPDPEAEASALDAAGKAFKPVSADELAEPVIEYIALDWGEYQARINASLAKYAEADRKAEMIDAVMAAGLLAMSDRGAVAIALAEVFAAMIPDGEPMIEIPEGWAPVALAINPATGDFVTLAGPRSAPDGRVEALETMLAKWGSDSINHTLAAVREAGRRQRSPVRAELVVAGPLDERTCGSCRVTIGQSVAPSEAAEYLRNVMAACECEGGCRLTAAHPAELEDEPEPEGEGYGQCPRRQESGACLSDDRDHWDEDRWKRSDCDWRLEWFPRSCSFCGGVQPDDAVRLIEEGWEPEIASGKRYKFYLHPPGHGERMRATLKGIREKGVNGMVDGWNPTPPVKAYTPHLSQGHIDRVNKRIHELKVGAVQREAEAAASIDPEEGPTDE